MCRFPMRYRNRCWAGGASEPNKSSISVTVIGLVAFLTFAIIECLFCWSFSEKYWQSYVLSIGVWVGMWALFYLLLATVTWMDEVISFRVGRSPRTAFKNSIFAVVLSSLAASFLYTTLEIDQILPHCVFSKFHCLMRMMVFMLFAVLYNHWKNYFLLRLPILLLPLYVLVLLVRPGLSLFNISIDILNLIVFFFLFYYLCSMWRGKDDQFIIRHCLIVIFLFGFFNISGFFIVISELNSRWMIKLSLALCFSFLLPFPFLVLAKKWMRFHGFSKALTAIVFIAFLILLEVYVLKPMSDTFTFRQSEVDRVTGTRSLTKKRHNIILIVMDTARAASMSIYGYGRRTTPHLEEFAKDAVIFKNAISSSSWTLPSHASLFTGLPCYLHGATHGPSTRISALPLDGSYTTLAELLSGKGFLTGAVVANYGFVAPWTGLNQGFSYFWCGLTREHVLMLPIVSRFFMGNESLHNLRILCGISHQNSAYRINQVALDWLKKVKDNPPWFLFINLMDTHFSEYLPAPYSRLFTEPPAPHWPKRAELTGQPITAPGEVDKIRAWYDSEMTYLDNEISCFFESLKAIGLYDETMIILTSDHGELLGEHYDFQHEHDLYQELLHVPLLIKYPMNENGGSVIQDMVQDIDVFAEILDQSDIPAPPGVVGQPLREVTHPVMSEVKRLPSFASRWPERYDEDLVSLYSRRIQDYKLIRSSRGTEVLFDLVNDPRELHPVYDETKMRMVESELDEYISNLDKITFEKRTRLPKELNETEERRLRALGYILR